MKPIEGAESEGALGFFKGVGKGLVGYVGADDSNISVTNNFSSAVTKPVVGVFDLASNVSEGKFISFRLSFEILTDPGIRNTTTVFDNPERDRVRLVNPSPYLSRLTTKWHLCIAAVDSIRRCASRTCYVVDTMAATDTFSKVIFSEGGYWSVLDEGSE